MMLRRFVKLFLALAILLPLALPGADVKSETVPDTAMLVWPPPPAPARIKWVGEIANEFDVGAKKQRKLVDMLAGKRQDVLALKRPVSVAIDPKGVLYVGDITQGVVGIDPKGRRMWLFPSMSGKVLAAPVGIAADSQMVYVCDSVSNSISVFDKEGHYLRGLGVLDGIKKPVGIAVDESKDLLVIVNAGENMVWLCNRSLKLSKKIGGRGSQDGRLNYPTYACIIPGTGFAVCDTGNFRVQIFDYNGRFVRSIGTLGDSSGQFSRPKGVAVDNEGHLYVVDSVFGNFQVFQLDGKLLTFVGTSGREKGMFNLPAGIAISKEGTIHVADQLNARIDVLQFLGGDQQ